MRVPGTEPGRACRRCRATWGAGDACPCACSPLLPLAFRCHHPPPPCSFLLASAKGAAAAIKQLVEAGYRVCVTHGNGPQVGMLALQDPAVSLSDFFNFKACPVGVGGRGA